MWFYIYRLTLPIDAFSEEIVKRYIHERINYAQEKKKNPYFFFFEKKKFYKGNEVNRKFCSDIIERWYQLLAEREGEYHKRKLPKRIVAFSFTVNPGVHEGVFADRIERYKFVRSFSKTMQSYVKEFFPDHLGILGIHRNTCYYHSHLFLNPVGLSNHKILIVSRKDIELYREFLLKKLERWINEFSKRKFFITEDHDKIEEEILKEKINWGLDKCFKTYLSNEKNSRVTKQSFELQEDYEVKIEEIVGLKGVLRKKMK